MTAYELARQLLNGPDVIVAMEVDEFVGEVVGVGYTKANVFGRSNPTPVSEQELGYPKKVEVVVLTTHEVIQ